MSLPWSVRARSKLIAAYKRITLNRLAAAFFIFGLVHCFLQGLIHSLLFTIDAEYDTLLTHIISAAQVPLPNHTYWDGSHQLFMCDWIPHNEDTCSVFFDTNTDLNASYNQDPATRGQVIMNGLASGMQVQQSNGSLTLMDQQGNNVTLDSQCTSMLLYPRELLHNYRREDLTWVFFQFWLFALSVAAMVNDSVPHILALFFSRLITTMWAMYTIYRTQQRKDTFWELIEQPGTPCSINMFTNYDQTRLHYEIADLVLSYSALGIAGYLTWNMCKVYSKQTFGYIGAPERVYKIYKYFLALQACLQLGVFVLVTAMSLWADQLFNPVGYINSITNHRRAYEVAVVTTTVVLIPWIMMGWYAIQREMKVVMGVFIFLTFGLIAGWSAMFYSQVYRWTFIAWPNLACWIVTSFILLILTTTLGIICWRNFGQGLAEYLRAEAALAASNFKPSVFETDAEKDGISWDPPPLAKVSIQRPGSPEELSEPTFYLSTLSRTESNRNSQESIASFFSPGSPRVRMLA